MKYDAFISYSHGNDARIAKALQENLHRLAKRWDSLSALRVFRDATHLPLTTLAPAIVSALTDSNFLVLLASRESAASEWVAKELTQFLETHPPEQVLVVLLDGELVWDPSTGRFAPGPESAFPPVEKFKLASEPLYLDLRWAAAEPDLSLSNPRFLDAVATLAATLQGVPKETLVGDLIEEHRRLRRSQRVNLGFRGAAGFGAAAALVFLPGAAFSFTSDAVLASAALGLWYLAVGFPLIGAVGALCVGLGWRGVAGFAAGFLMLLPYYFMGSFRPFESSLLDYLVLGAMSLGGFVLAGSVGAAACKGIRWSDGAKAFGLAGVVVALVWLVFGEFRPAGISTELAAWPWLPTRFWLLGRRALEVVASIFDERDTGMLIPLIVGVTAGGLVLGVLLADARTKTVVAGAEVKARPMPFLLKPRAIGSVLVGVLVVTGVAWSFRQTNAHQVAAASRVLTAETFEGLLAVGENNTSKEMHGLALPLALRSRNALERLGEHTTAEQISAVIREAIQTLAQTPSRYYEQYKNPGYHPADLGDIARTLKKLGRPEELALLLDGAHEHLKDADLRQVIEIARTESSYGSKDRAEAARQTAVSRLGEGDASARSLLALLCLEMGHSDEAMDLLQKSGATVAGSSAPRSPAQLVLAGLLDSRTEDRSLGEESDALLTAAIEETCRIDECGAVVPLIEANRDDTLLWHKHALLAKAAAGAQRYDTAFAMLDALEQKENPGWTNFSDRAEGLTEIIRAAASHGDLAVVQKAVAQLKMVEQTVRERSELNRFAGVTIATAYALAGDYEAAGRVARDVKDDPWEADRQIGIVLSEAGQGPEAESMLARAWRGLQEHAGRESRANGLEEIGTALARIGKLKAARSVARDIGSDFAHYSGGFEALAQLSIYTAIVEYAPAVNRHP